MSEPSAAPETGLRRRVQALGERYPALPYVAPFVVFLSFLAFSGTQVAALWWLGPIWVLVCAAVCYLCWPKELRLTVVKPWASIALGILVLLIWIAPEWWMPAYRSLPPFRNAIVGQVHSSIPAADLRSAPVLAWRTARATAIVAIVEELFWRGWLMRWLIDPHFRRLPLGTYRRWPFLLTALLFASEHGSYWDVGLVAGLLYGWWMVRTRSVPDCIVAHAVTNGLLSAYVLTTGQWQYWQ